MAESLDFKALLACANGLQVESVSQLARLDEVVNENRALRERLRYAEEYIYASESIRVQTLAAMGATVFHGKRLIIDIWSRPHTFKMTKMTDGLYDACTELERLADEKPDVKTDSGECYVPPRKRRSISHARVESS